MEHAVEPPSDGETHRPTSTLAPPVFSALATPSTGSLFDAGSSTPSALDSEDSPDEDDLEAIASQIVESTPVDSELLEEDDEPEPVLSGGYSMSGLRQRVRSIKRQMRKDPVRSEPVSNGEEMTPLARAQKELEDQMVAAFLERVAKQVQEVKVRPINSKPAPYPSRRAYASYPEFGHAYFDSLLEHYAPLDLNTPPSDTKFSIRQCRSHAERMYIISPPSVVIHLLGGAKRLYRWESPYTLPFLLIYLLFWAFKLLVLLPILILLYLLLRQVLYPPSPERIALLASLRAARERDAKALASSHSIWRLAGLKKRKERRPKSDRTSALARGLQSTIGPLGLPVGLPFGNSTPPRSTPSSVRPINPDGAFARALGSASSFGGIAAPSKVEIQGLKSKESDDDSDGPDSEAEMSLYRLAMLLGPEVQDTLNTAADISEKLKNAITRPDHPSTRIFLFKLAGLAIVVMLLPRWALNRFVTLYPAVEFFALFRLRELHPDWRRALTPFWWMIYDLPTDADLATYILKRRAASQKPLVTKPNLPRHVHMHSTGSVTSLADLMGSTVGVGSGVATPGRVPTIVEADTGPILSSHFCFHSSTPGSLDLSSTHVHFVPSTSRGTHRSILMAHIFGVKKEKKFGIDGLRLETPSGELSFKGVVKRDEAFNRIVAGTRV